MKGCKQSSSINFLHVPVCVSGLICAASLEQSLNSSTWPGTEEKTTSELCFFICYIK